MKRLPPILLVAGLIGLLGAAPPTSPETLLEQGNAALNKGDFTGAIALYEQAEPRAADPGQVTLYLAIAKYQRYLKDNSASDLTDARQLYGYLLGEQEPRWAAALLGLGNCLLQLAGERDADVALQAVEAYEQCLQLAEDDTLRADAQHNLERAKLRLSQIRRAEETKPDKEPDDGDDPKNPKPKKPMVQPPNPMDGGDPDHKSGGHPKPDGPGQNVKPKPGDQSRETDQPPPGGKGQLPPVPDRPDLPPLSAKDALEHLKLANDRIWRERHQHRLGLAKPPAEGVRDW